jgi:hypothetical protein
MIAALLYGPKWLSVPRPALFRLLPSAGKALSRYLVGCSRLVPKAMPSGLEIGAYYLLAAVGDVGSGVPIERPEVTFARRHAAILVSAVVSTIVWAAIGCTLRGPTAVIWVARVCTGVEPVTIVWVAGVRAGIRSVPIARVLRVGTAIRSITVVWIVRVRAAIGSIAIVSIARVSATIESAVEGASYNAERPANHHPRDIQEAVPVKRTVAVVIISGIVVIHLGDRRVIALQSNAGGGRPGIGCRQSGKYGQSGGHSEKESLRGHILTPS